MTNLCLKLNHRVLDVTYDSTNGSIWVGTSNKTDVWTLELTDRSINVVWERRASSKRQSQFHVVASATDYDRRIRRWRFHVSAQAGHGKVSALGYRRWVGHRVKFNASVANCLRLSCYFITLNDRRDYEERWQSKFSETKLIYFS